MNRKIPIKKIEKRVRWKKIKSKLTTPQYLMGKSEGKMRLKKYS